METVTYFVNYQLATVVPTTIFMMIVYYFTSKYYDKRGHTISTGEPESEETSTLEFKEKPDICRASLLPIVILLLFRST